MPNGPEPCFHAPSVARPAATASSRRKPPAVCSARHATASEERPAVSLAAVASAGQPRTPGCEEGTGAPPYRLRVARPPKALQEAARSALRAARAVRGDPQAVGVVKRDRRDLDGRGRRVQRRETDAVDPGWHELGLVQAEHEQQVRPAWCARSPEPVHRPARSGKKAIEPRARAPDSVAVSTNLSVATTTSAGACTVDVISRTSTVSLGAWPHRTGWQTAAPWAPLSAPRRRAQKAGSPARVRTRGKPRCWTRSTVCSSWPTA